MKVLGDADDTVKLSNLLPDGSSDLGHWTQQAGTVEISGLEYDVFVHSGFNAELLVQDGIATHLIT